MRRSGFLRAAVVLAALAVPAAAQTPADARSRVIEGSAAQALRCATYIVMAGQYGYAEGRISAGERAVMAGWSAMVLGAHVAPDPAARLAAYGAALTELDSEPRTRDLIARHGEWCLRAFTLGTL